MDSAPTLLHGTPRDGAEAILERRGLDEEQIEEILGPDRGRGHPLGAVFEELAGRGGR